MNLSDTLIRNMRSDGSDTLIMDAGLPGFGLRITKSGAKILVVRAKVRGRLRRHTLGKWPALSVKDARKQAVEALDSIRAGLDPTEARRARVLAREAGLVTVGDFADRWLKEHVRAKLKPRTVSDYEKIVFRNIKPALGALTLAAVSRRDVLAMHGRMSTTPVRANRVLAVASAIFRYAEDLELRGIGTNPAKRIKKYREKIRERFLSEPEIAEAAGAIADAETKGKIGPHAAAGLRLCLFTGARSGEIVAAKWEHIDWQRNILRLPDSKTNEPRTIHLSPAALDVLTDIDRIGTYVIAGRKKGEPFTNLKRSWIVARKFRGLDNVRLHDLRHSFASLAAGRGVSLQMIGKLLGHKRPATTQRYAHLARDAAAAVNDELGAAMLAAIEKTTVEGDRIVKFKRRKKRA